LTNEKLRGRNWKWVVGEDDQCIAPFKNANGEIQKGCGELYASHPPSAQGKEHIYFFSLFLHRAVWSALKSLYISHLISPSRLLLSVK
jgi:hypothetical protein